MKTTTTVTHCIHGCPFWGTKGGSGTPMICKHPALEDEMLMRNRLMPKIDYFIHKDSVPDNCPLKTHPVITEVKFGESNDTQED
jgi:hypothetical protein